MIETIMLNHLSARLPVPVHAEIPSNPPASFVVIVKGEGGKENHIRSAMMLARSYADTMAKAAKLSEQVIAAMDSFAEHPNVSGCHLTNDYLYTDTASKRYCYQAVFDIYHY